MAAPVAAQDWRAIESEATALLQSYIRLDTTNPPGNEIAAANLLAARFRSEGIETELFEAAPGRASLMARLPGDGIARPIVLLNHLDVVPARAEEWQHPPFAAEIHEGFVYGRGAIDCKGPGVIEAMALLTLKRTGKRLARDVIFLGTADEEVGGAQGAGWFVEHHLDQLGNPELVLNEGSFISVNGPRRIYEVSASEKTPCWLRLTARGEAGHGSTPPRDTAPEKLIQALGRVIAYQPPIEVRPDVQEYYATLAQFETGKRAAAYRDLGSALQDPAFRNEFFQDPIAAALVRTTIAPTVLNGSSKTNVIPREASADLDCRLLPGEDPDGFVRTINGIVDDDDVAVEVILNFPPSSSATDTPLFRAIREVGQAEGAVVVPKMLRGFTDSHFFRAKGIASYGFIPFDIGPEDDKRMHGIDERVSTTNLREGTRRLVEILTTLDRIDRM